jgi:hypothetical protein
MSYSAEVEGTGSPRGEVFNTLQRPASDSRTPALPGIEGFYVSPDDGAVNTLASALASEAENDTWSGTMEAGLLDRISRLHDREVVTVNVECRSMTCGSILVFSRNSDEFSRRVNFPRIADELGFQLRAGLATIADDGTPFTVFYMQMAPELGR